jgi:hypothetical protein
MVYTAIALTLSPAYTKCVNNMTYAKTEVGEIPTLCRNGKSNQDLKVRYVLAILGLPSRRSEKACFEGLSFS